MTCILRYYTALVCVALLAPSAMASAGTISVDVSHKDRHNPGDSILVEWSSDGIPTKTTLAIYLASVEQGFLYPIAQSLPLAGSFRWEIPESTAAAEDYHISMSTEDKGPSVESNHSEEFEITGGNEGYAITNTSVTVDEGKSGKGIVTLSFDTNRPLDKAHYLKLNIACSEEVSIRAHNSAKTTCNSWVGLDDRAGTYMLDYEVAGTESEHIHFTIDLYTGSILLQRVFVDRVTLPGADEHSSNLNMTLRPEGSVDHQEQLVIRFWDIDADYYKVVATCEGGISLAGKARPNLCEEAEVLYPTGKDVLRVDHIYPYNRTGSIHSATVYVEAYKDDELVEHDWMRVNVHPYDVTGVSKPKLDTPPAGGTGGTRTHEEMLDMVAEIFGSDSDAYRLVKLFIAIGLIK